MAIAIIAVAFFVKKQPYVNPDAPPKLGKRFEKPIKKNPDNNHTIKASLDVHKENEDDHPTITVTPGNVQTEESKWETQFFNNYVDETLKKLPTKEKLEGLNNDDVHHTPKFIMETGLRLGKIKKQVKLNKDFAPKAMDFYEGCAKKDESFTPIRGLCLANLMYLKKELGESFDPSPYPEKVQDLAKKAMEFSF